MIKLNLDKSTLHFICNGSDLGNALLLKDTLKKIKNEQNTEFRLAVCVQGKDTVKIIFDANTE